MGVGFALFIPVMAVVVIAWAVATPLTIRHTRVVQETGRFIIGCSKVSSSGLIPKPSRRASTRLGMVWNSCGRRSRKRLGSDAGEDRVPGGVYHEVLVQPERGSRGLVRRVQGTGGSGASRPIAGFFSTKRKAEECGQSGGACFNLSSKKAPAHSTVHQKQDKRCKVWLLFSTGPQSISNQRNRSR